MAQRGKNNCSQTNNNSTGWDNIQQPENLKARGKKQVGTDNKEERNTDYDKQQRYLNQDSIPKSNNPFIQEYPKHCNK